MENKNKSIMIPLIISLIALGTGIWLIEYSAWGMSGLRDIAPLAELPDTISSPTFKKYYKNFNNMGEEGRAFYLSNIRLIDTFFPFLYAFPLYLGILAAMRRMTKINLVRKLVPSIAFIPVIFDLLENHYLHSLALNFPNMDEDLVQLIIFITSAKAISLRLIFFAVIAYWIIIGMLSLISKYSKKIKQH
ncbi:MAG: hypothetical protein ACOCUV_01875 [bacterium]